MEMTANFELVWNLHPCKEKKEFGTVLYSFKLKSSDFFGVNVSNYLWEQEKTSTQTYLELGDMLVPRRVSFRMHPRPPAKKDAMVTRMNLHILVSGVPPSLQGKPTHPSWCETYNKYLYITFTQPDFCCMKEVTKRVKLQDGPLLQ